MKHLLVFACAVTLPACGVKYDLGPAPEIYDLTIQSPVASDTTKMSGSVHVRDPLGLTLLMVNLTVLDPAGPPQTLTPIAVGSTVEGQLEATVGFRLKSINAFAGGSYQVEVTVTEGGVVSNSLTSTMIVE